MSWACSYDDLYREDEEGLSGGAVAGIVIGSIAGVALLGILGAVFCGGDKFKTLVDKLPKTSVTKVDKDQDVGETRIAKIKLKIGWGPKSSGSQPEAMKSLEMPYPYPVPDISQEVLAVGSDKELEAREPDTGTGYI